MVFAINIFRCHHLPLTHLMENGEKCRHVVRTINKSQALHENSIFNAIRLSTEGAWEAELHFDIERKSISKGRIKTINIV